MNGGDCNTPMYPSCLSLSGVSVSSGQPSNHRPTNRREGDSSERNKRIRHAAATTRQTDRHLGICRPKEEKREEEFRSCLLPSVDAGRSVTCNFGKNVLNNRISGRSIQASIGRSKQQMADERIMDESMILAEGPKTSTLVVI